MLRALELQFVYVLIVFIVLFAIGLPLVVIFAFPWGLDLGLLGMWYSCPLAYFLLNVALLVAILSKNWEEYSLQVMNREKMKMFTQEFKFQGPEQQA